ncbi:MAG: hypothetical protein SFU53_01465 [Terrimicrobiaceae bacterium]|nr:hypothetical protein [Terrimicrobiaceae bacterium]
MQSLASSAVARLVILGSATLGGLGLAMFAGRAVAQGEYSLVAMIAGALLGVTIFLWIGRSAYIFLAIATGLTGSIGILPLPFSYQELMIFGCFAITIAHLAFKKIQLEGRKTILDLIVWLNLLYIASVFLRNPVGFRALGSEMVGGRPYLSVIVAALFFFAISQYKIPAKLAPRFPLILAAPVLILTSVAAAAFFVPAIGTVVYPFWTGVGLGRGTIEAVGGTTGPAAKVLRVPTSQIGITLALLLCAYYPVSRIISPMSPRSFLLFGVALVGWLASGFRSGILVIGSYLFYNSWLRRRLQDLIPLTLVGIIMLAIVVVGQGTLFNLPLGMQRALSFIPGNWHPEAASDATASTEWRLEIWREVWTNKEFIKDRWFGDGFGFSAYDLKIQVDALLGWGGYLDGSQAQMITGAYHNGPLSTIRYVGVAGLILYFFLQLTLLTYSAKLVRRAWGTPFQALTLYLAVPQLYAFLSFYIVFGGYDSDFPRSLFTAGLLKITDLSLRDYQARSRATVPPVETITATPAPANARA